MNRLKPLLLIALVVASTTGCASYGAYQKARKAEATKDWDSAVVQYEKALEVDPNNMTFKLALDRSKRESSRAHFEKAKSIRAALNTASGNDQARLAQMAVTELQLTLKLDPTNQYAAIEFDKTVQLIEQLNRAAAENTSIDDVKKRAKANTSKAQPPQLNPASDQPISLSFPRETPVKDIYRALGNAFGINILFDQAVKDDRISIELRDVTAQQALERVMQAANHFYKVLDEKTIIVVPDNPQARRDYEDLVIRTFYLSNGDAEQVTNVVRTMIEARNVFPLKALNAITIRDTADKVRIAEKIIEANDKAKAEVVVAVELVQIDLTKARDIGFAISGFPGAEGKTSPIAGAVPQVVGADNKLTTFTGGTLSEIARVLGSMNDLRRNISFTIPQATYSLLKTLGDSQLLANPELRISEGEKATLHIGQRIPVPVSTFTSVAPGTGTSGTYAPVTSYQYQDVGIKVSMEPRVHHNREVTLKLTVEVSNVGAETVEGQPTFATRTIESTIRLKDGETNFLAGLIQTNDSTSSTKTPFLGELPFIGRLFTRSSTDHSRTDLVLTMTPHIVRIPDITEDDVAPMWVGTTNNLTFRGVSPRIESQNGGDPFIPPSRPGSSYGTTGGGGNGGGGAQYQLAPDGEPGNYVLPEGAEAPAEVEPIATPPRPTQGGAPTDPFRRPTPTPPPPAPPSNEDASLNAPVSTNPATSTASTSSASKLKVASSAMSLGDEAAALRLAPRIAPQPANLTIKPGEAKTWTIIGMDLEGLQASELQFHFDPTAIDISEVALGSALAIDTTNPPSITIDRTAGTLRIASKDGKALTFQSGGVVLSMRLFGGVAGETYLVMDNPKLQNGEGTFVMASVAGGRATVQ
ncbi:MAG TPA: secretin N-terminal domain-containing protein [Thermoanaerobaculia bacterium]|nr:secretin N-terminal domain-containing protein [Thermoanaerobaculia bacterium]